MNLELRKAFAVAIVAAFGFAPLATSAEQQSDGANSVPLSTVIAAVAKRSGKKFIVDPRVRGDAVVLGENPTTLSYDAFLLLMGVHGFVAVPTGEYVRLVPDASVRQMAIPIADGDKYSLSEYVTRVVSVKNIPATMLVPILRPLLPQQAHLVAMPCTNDLIMVDTFGNIQRLEKVIKSLDRGEPYVPKKCEPGDPVPFRAPDKGGDKADNR